MDIDELVLSTNPRSRSVRHYKPKDANIVRFKKSKSKISIENQGPSERDVLGLWPYRSLSTAYTVMLQLVKPEYRDFHRSRNPVEYY